MPQDCHARRQFRHRGTAVRHARCRRHVGRRRFVGHRRAACRRRLRRHRHHAAALRSWSGDAPQRRLLRRPRHSRRPRGRRAHRHSPLRARLREPLQGSGDRPLRPELRLRARRRCRAWSAISRSSSATCWKPRASSAPSSWRPAITSHRGRCRAAAARCIAPARPSATRAIFCSPPHRAQLDLLRFPLGDRTKAETRELARRFGLSVADKQDSQDICFVPTGHYAQVIERLRPGAAGPGEIVDLDGRVLGRHDGIIHFTVGQRRGLGIATGAPLYVVRLEAATRRVVVGPREALRTSRIRLRDINWLGDGTLDRRGRERCGNFCQSPLDPAAAAGLAAFRRRRHRGRADRRRGRRFARPSLRVLRRGRRPGPRARRRLHRQHRRGAKRPMRTRRWPPCADGARAQIRSYSVRVAGVMGEELDKRESRRRMRAGRRSTISCSARCSSAGARPAIAAAERIGGRILEVGVGTGLSLPEYAWSNRIIGVDLSAPMLRKAKERVQEHRLTNVDGLAVMDAQRLGFQDAVFDVVVAQYVITAVPEPEATLDEFARVLKPGGEIILVNHLAAESGLRALFERWLRAARPPARLADGIRLRAPGRLGGAPRRRAHRRAPPDAATWAFFADPVCEGRRLSQDRVEPNAAASIRSSRWDRRPTGRSARSNRQIHRPQSGTICHCKS